MSRPRVERCFALANRVIITLTDGQSIEEKFLTHEEARDYVETVWALDALLGRADDA